MVEPTARCAIALLLSVSCGVAWADDREGVEYFERNVRPLLVKHCYECHSADAKELKGGLTLQSKAGWTIGGESGPAIVPGDPEQSLLIEAVRYEGLEMPPDGRLNDSEIAALEKWIRIGAPDPRKGDPPGGQSGKMPESIDWDQARQSWAYRPLRRPDIPEVGDKRWPRGALDRFILAKLEAASGRPAGDADRGTLLRRLSFDLIGLPPSPTEIEAFGADDSPRAVEKIVDRLLGSPEFGERWGRHWLDIARYADSTGGGRSLLFDAAWRYRDYTIESFNDDKPFDRFIIEQIAGDLLPYDDYETGREQLIATGFLALGPTNYELQDKQQLRMDVVDEQLDTIGRAFLGMTIGCARCHDHKFDPIPTRDYYALAGILRSTRTLIHDNVSKWVSQPLPLPIAEQQRLDKYLLAMADVKERIKTAKARTTELQGVLGVVTLDDAAAKLVGTWRASTSVKPYAGESYRYAQGEGCSATYELSIAHDGVHEVRVSYTPHPNRIKAATYTVAHRDGNTEVQIDQTQPPPIDGMYASLGRFPFATKRGGTVVVRSSGNKGALIIDAVKLIRVESESESNEAEAFAELNEVQSQLAKLQSEQTSLLKAAPPGPEQAMAVAEHAEQGDCKIRIRGDIHNLGEVAPRGFLTIASSGTAPRMASDSSGRLELARWIASPENPLTARVAVNRIWQHLFGRGLVATVDNFGSTGDPPTHPELVDYLAIRFVDLGWSVKALVREIALSRAYGLSGATERSVENFDPQNLLLARRTPRRLDAEAIRDAILLFGGRLEPGGGGDAVRAGTKTEVAYEFDERHRSVYLPIFRNRLHELFEVFDFPDPNLSIGRRTTSTLATQSLYMMNSPLVIDHAQFAAERLLSDVELDDRARLDLMYRRALGRGPRPEEESLAMNFLESSGASDLTTSEEHRLELWAALCQTLIASIDFRYVY